MIKEQVHQAVAEYLESKINTLKSILQEAYDAAAADGKSSAGDKHETATSMAQLEQEKITHQLNELLEQKNMLNKLNPHQKHTNIDVGSLVETESDWFYISLGIGAININNEKVYCISPFAPLGLVLKGKKAGDDFSFNKKGWNIIEVK